MANPRDRAMLLKSRTETPRAGAMAIGALAALLGAGAFSMPASAQQAAAAPAPVAETVTRSVHDDWIVRCKDRQGKASCEAVQTLKANEQKGILAHLAVHVVKGGPVHFLVQVPPGVWLPANVTFKVPGVEPLLLTYKRCGTFCLASLELKPEQVTALKASSGSGELVFETGSRSPVIVPVSFKGLGAAIEAALKAG